jgi:hypothetical protein
LTSKEPRRKKLPRCCSLPPTFEAIEMHPKINDSKGEEPGILEPLQPSLL